LKIEFRNDELLQKVDSILTIFKFCTLRLQALLEKTNNVMVGYWAYCEFV